MGFIMTVIAVALGIALAPFILPALVAAGGIAAVIAGVVLALGLVALIVANFSWGWITDIAIGAASLLTIAYLFKGLSLGLEAARSGLGKIPDHGKTLPLLRAVTLGVVGTLILMPFPLFLLFTLGFIGFSGVFLSNRDPDLRWQESLAIPMWIAFTSLLILVGVTIILIVAGIMDDWSELLEHVGLWEGGRGGGYSYPLFRDFIIPPDWPFSSIRRLN